jgi:arylsulfatase A-like enzyme
MKLARAALLLVFGVAACLACSSPEPELPTNVVLIVIDDLGWTDTGVYGSTFYETPNIDALAAGGARFTQFYTASPVCSPTRASLMTGRHPARLDLTNWIGGEQNGLLTQAEYIRQLPHEQVTIGEVFTAQGYSTGYIGKWHLGRAGYLPDTQGFEFTAAVNEAGQPGSYFPPYENPDWPITDVPDLAGDPQDSYLTDRLTDAALQFIETNRDRPFFLVLSHYAVHTPLQAPSRAVWRYEQKAGYLGPDGAENYEPERESVTKLRQDHPTYAAMVESTDLSVGRILAALADLGLDSRTVVVFVSDNGGLSTLTRRGFNQATANAPLRAGKGWLYDGGIRVPLIVRWPGRIRPGTVVDDPAMSMDLFPTLLDMAGLPARPDQHADGTSLTGAMTAGTVAREALYWHFPHYHGSGNRPGGAIRAGNLKLVEWFEDGSVELYDLSDDISERRDLSVDRPADTARLLGALRAWRQEVGANMPTER